VRVRGDIAVRVFSVHLETPVGVGPGAKRDQARAVLASAAGEPRVIVAGDFNGRAVAADVFAAGGLLWLTRDVGRTISLFSWDHLLTRGFRLAGCASVGSAPNALRVSDHVPVWAEIVPE
jgi:endonuclease/exonuclease/phosphatase family metal-dependent hydrolase